MSGRDLFQPYPEARSASTDKTRAVCALHTPRQNRLLAALPAADYARLLPDLEPVALPTGWTVHRAGEQEKYVYFLTAGMVSRFYVMQNGASARLAVTGREGVVGVASFLGGESTPSQAVVLSPGYAYRLRAEVLRNEFARAGPLLHLLLRYTLALIVQTAQIAVCNRHHSLDQQICRWLLLSLDRAPGNELPMTQELIANMLGVRREGVTEAAGKLQHAGLIRYSRGHITVLDRARLEAQACECYAVVKREYDRLLNSEDTAEDARGRDDAVPTFRRIAVNRCPGASQRSRPALSEGRIPEVSLRQDHLKTGHERIHGTATGLWILRPASGFPLDAFSPRMMLRIERRTPQARNMHAISPGFSGERRKS